MQKLPPGMPPNLALSLFGVNGLTAYFGIIGDRPDQSRRNRRGVERRRRHGFCRRPDRQDQRLPRHRHRGRQGKMRLARQRGAFRRRHRLQKRRHRRSTFGTLPQRDRRLLRQCRRRASSTRSSRASTSTRASCCAVRYRNPTPSSQARELLQPCARRARMRLHRLDYPTRVPEAFDALAAGSETAASCTRRTWWLASRMRRERCCACLPARTSASSS